MRNVLAFVAVVAWGTTGCGYSVETIPLTSAPDSLDAVTPAVVSRAPPPLGSQRVGSLDARKCWYGTVAACHERLGAEASARFGANYVQVIDDGARVTWCAWSAPRCEGVAYRSAALQQVTDPAARKRRDRASCTKDTDCEGELICADGRCVAPRSEGR